MASYEKEVLALLTTEVFKKIMKSNAIQLIQLNAATNLLIKLGIPFDLFFLPGTRRQAAVAELVIFINPTTTIDFTISLETGGPVLGLE